MFSPVQMYGRTKQEDDLTKFMDWLADEAKGRNVVWYVIFAGLVVVSLDYAIEAALLNWHLIPAPPIPHEGDTPFKYYNPLAFVSMFVWAPVKEEIIFRVLPLSIVIAFVQKTPAFVFGAMVTFAALFGAIHPYSAVGEVSVAIAGFFFGLVFLKCGGLNENFVKASICAMAAHGVSNLLTVLDAWWQYFELVIR